MITSGRGTKISAKQKAVQLLRNELKEIGVASYFLTSSNCKTETEEEKQAIASELEGWLEKFNELLR